MAHEDPFPYFPYITQTQIGQVLGMSAQEVGRQLIELGLRDGPKPSKEALESGLAKSGQHGAATADTDLICTSWGMSDICKQSAEEIAALESEAKAQGKKLKVEVIADSSGQFCGNGLRFETSAAALSYADGLYCRWTAVREYRVAIADE